MLESSIQGESTGYPPILNPCMSVASDRPPLQPFLKWPGGKRWLIEKHKDLLPHTIRGRYIEPFLGGGAVFFHLCPQSAVLSDVNRDLIETYEEIRLNFRSVVTNLWEHHCQHQQSPERYYAVRAEEPETADARVARFIYLNRTCFNGIYRVNRNGKFNVPKGSKIKVIMPDDDWQGWSMALQDAELLNSDFQPVIDGAEKGDFLFVDPPYTVHHNLNGFIKYNEVLFSWEDQIRLAESLDLARKRGAKILMTNASHESVRALYGRGFKKSIVSRFSSMSANSAARSSFEELIITT
jgi:DNA adenine methylase